MSGPDTYRVEPITAAKVCKGDKLLMVDKWGARVIEVLSKPEHAIAESARSAYLADTQWLGVKRPVNMVIGYPRQTLLKVHDDG